MNKIKIGITDCTKYLNYQKWFENAPERVDVIKLSYKSGNLDQVADCDGIVLSGGEDIFPEFYNKPEYLSILDIEEIDRNRDEFEFKVIRKTLSLNKPILGICRGLQVMNVFLGGTLVPDIPSVLDDSQHHKIEGIDQEHSITAEADTMLVSISGEREGEVNSAHHQSVDSIADQLLVSARSGPNVIEAMEWKEMKDKSWLLLVQWHPERMPDQKNPFAANIRTEFLKNCLVS